jgi:hypothetical protein
VDERGLGESTGAEVLKVPQWHPELGGGASPSEAVLGGGTSPSQAGKTTDGTAAAQIDRAVKAEAEGARAGHYNRTFTQRVNLWMTNAAMRERMLDPGLGRMVAQLTGSQDGR